MEDSISTGMRVIDLAGKITYVNRAFCRMFGFDESELLGVMPPYPYWLPEELDINQRHMQQIFDGEARLPASIPGHGTRTATSSMSGCICRH
jgi:PAS domain S-box-containing protein